MPFTTTALMNVSQRAAIAVTQFTLFMSSGLNTRSVAFAAGTIAETMKIQHSTRSDHPAKNPVVFPNTILTQANDVPAFGATLFKLIKANAIPNIMSPHTRMLAGEKIPVVATMVEVVI